MRVSHITSAHENFIGLLVLVVKIQDNFWLSECLPILLVIRGIGITNIMMMNHYAGSQPGQDVVSMILGFFCCVAGVDEQDVVFLKLVK